MLRSIFLIFFFAVFSNAKLARRDLPSNAILRGDTAQEHPNALPDTEPKISLPRGDEVVPKETTKTDSEPKISLPRGDEVVPKETTKNLSPSLSKQGDPFHDHHHHHYHYHVSNQGKKCCNQDKLEALIKSIKEQSELLRQMAKHVVRHLDVNIVSEGCNDKGRHGGCGNAFIKVNGRERSLKGRGYNVVVLNRGGCFEEAKSFDTHANRNEVRKLVNFIKNIPANSIVLMAIQDDASFQVLHNILMSKALGRALKSVGCQDPFIRHYRHSWACAGHKGGENVSWVKHDQRRQHRGPTHLSVKIPY